MVTMTAVDTAGRFTRADLDAMPDDGRRYELLDGAIVVTPTPTFRHQRVTFRLARVLDDIVPSGLTVCISPLDVFLPTGDVLQPDVFVISEDAVVDDKVQGGVPLLVVEVLSPSSRRRDAGDKLTAYRDAGVPSYWVVDPITPSLRAWELRDGEYIEVAAVSGDEEWTARKPYSVTVRPSDLLK